MPDTTATDRSSPDSVRASCESRHTCQTAEPNCGFSPCIEQVVEAMQAVAPEPDDDGALPPGWRWDETSEMTRRWPVTHRLERIVYFDAVKCSCDGGWVEDEGWQPDYLGPGVQSKRTGPGDGYIPCGLCASQSPLRLPRKDRLMSPDMPDPSLSGLDAPASPAPPTAPSPDPGTP